MEKDFFITEYMSGERKELKCKIKELYSDFIVNEITPDGTVLDLPSPKNSETSVEDEEVKKSSTKINEIPAPACVPQEVVSEIDALLQDKCRYVEIATEDMDKKERTLIHDWIRSRYYGALDSQTVARVIRVSVPDERTVKRRNWPADRPDYVHFTLCKENKDTHYALSVIAKFLRMKNTSFGICGTKDRRGITTQRASVYRCEIERLQALNTKLRGIVLTDFALNSEQCKLGDLLGNRFKIVLRDVQQIAENEWVARIEDFMSKGFINYFGTQRFGSCGCSTAEIGLSILKKEWEVAVKTILKPRNTHGSIREALDEWNKSGNASAAVKKLTGGQVYATIEGQLLSALSRNKCNYHAALMKLARNVRSLYVHAYQSLLWNKVASRRVQSKGIRAIPGDLNVSGKNIEDFEKEEVALPLLSGSVQLPNNEVREWYEQIMKEDGVTTAMFEALERNYAIGEVMRPLVVRPQDVKYKLMAYPCARMKLQRDLKGNVDLENVGAGDFRAVLLEFSLPSGTYATAALREITRCDVSRLAQTCTAEGERDAI